VYGNVTFFHGLGQKILVINTRQAAEDLLAHKTATAGRPKLTMCGELCGWDTSIILRQPSKEFREMRKAINSVVGKMSIEGRSIPMSAIGAYLKKLLGEPERFLEHNRWLTGGIMLNLAYGYKPQPDNDPLIGAVEAAIAEFAELIEPGAWSVDMFPFLKYIPAWFPGASFQRKAVLYRASTENLSIKPWNMVKKAMQHGTARPSLCTDLIAETQDRALSPEEELYRSWMAGNV